MLIWIIAVVVLLIPVPAGAAGENPSDDEIFTGSNPTLTQQELDAIARGERANEGGSPAMATPSGYLKFPFGNHQTSIVCAPFQVCDIALQPGEHLHAINIGDNVRWSIEPAISGSGTEEVHHLIIKTREVGLDTSVVVTTDRRVYHLRLRSHRTRFMPQIAFSYPEEATQKFQALQISRAQDLKKRTITGTKDYLPKLDFNYAVSGSAKWKPDRVYNDGTRTVIQMPPTMTQMEAPVLLIVRKDGGLFSAAEEVMVNYNLQEGRYIVDAVFDKAVLLAGVGSNQDRITIERRTP